MKLPPFVAGGLDLVLFDLDGTLVDTEHLHFQAYRQAFERVGVVNSNLKLADYCHVKHVVDGEDALLLSAMRQGLGDALMSPGTMALLDAGKKAKKAAYHELRDRALETDTLHMVAGAQSTLEALQAAGISTVIVTHSGRPTFEKLAVAFPCLGSVKLRVFCGLLSM